MVYVLLAIIGIPLVCIIGYALLDSAMIEANKKKRECQRKKDEIKYEKEKDDYRKETLNKANELVSKYLVSPLTSSLLDEINKITFGTGYYIHRVDFNSSFGYFIIDGGTNQTMYIGDLSRLGETSSLAKLGYKFPEGRGYNIHAVALLTAIAQKLGSSYILDISYDYDDDKQINGVRILSKNLKMEEDLKSPI